MTPLPEYEPRVAVAWLVVRIKVFPHSPQALRYIPPESIQASTNTQVPETFHLEGSLDRNNYLLASITYIQLPLRSRTSLNKTLLSTG
jgi:hypothetical protein